MRLLGRERGGYLFITDWLRVPFEECTRFELGIFHPSIFINLIFSRSLIN